LFGAKVHALRFREDIRGSRKLLPATRDISGNGYCCERLGKEPTRFKIVLPTRFIPMLKKPEVDLFYAAGEWLRDVSSGMPRVSARPISRAGA
jgi:hypothetical protein